MSVIIGKELHQMLERDQIYSLAFWKALISRNSSFIGSFEEEVPGLSASRSFAGRRKSVSDY